MIFLTKGYFIKSEGVASYRTLNPYENLRPHSLQFTNVIPEKKRKRREVFGEKGYLKISLTGRTIPIAQSITSKAEAGRAKEGTLEPAK